LHVLGGSDKEEAALLKKLCDHCDQRKVFALLGQRLPHDSKIVKLVMDEYLKVPNNQIDRAQFRGLLQVAAKLTDPEIFDKLVEKGNDVFKDDDPYFMITTVDSKSGNGLLSIATLTGTMVLHQ